MREPVADNSLRSHLAEQKRRGHERPRATPSEVAAATHVLARRLVAFAIDCAALVAMGALASMLSPQYLAALGERSWWIALPIAAAYFTLLDGPAGRGRTLGKRMMAIEVHGADGRRPGFVDAFLRLCPLALVFAIVKFSIFADQYSGIIQALNALGALVTAGIIILPLTHPEQRSLHDLLLNTIVVRSGTEYRPAAWPLRRPMVAMLISGVLIALAGGAVASHMALSRTRQLESTLVRTLLAAVPGIEHAQAFFTSQSVDGGPPFGVLRLSAFVTPGIGLGQGELAAGRMVKAIGAAGLLPPQVAEILVEVRGGFDIGLFRRMQHESFNLRIPPEFRSSAGSAGAIVPRFRSVPGLSRRSPVKPAAPATAPDPDAPRALPPELLPSLKR